MMASPLGGLIEDLVREDNDRGPEPEPDTGEGSIRTLIPYTPQVAQIAAIAPDRAPFAGGGLQCDNCGGWFGVTFWTCGACRAIAARQVETLMDDNRQLPLHPHTVSRWPRLGDGRAP